MKKTKLIIFLLLTFLIVFTGCGSSEPKFTVTFYDGSGKVIKTEEVTVGKDATAPADPIIENTAEFSYEFTGWNKDYSNVQADLKVYPTYNQTINKYTYKFYDYDDTLLKEVNTYYGSLIIPPVLGTREAPLGSRYDFLSWGKDIEKLVGDISFKAEYKLVKYNTLTIYKANLEEVSEQVMVDEGKLPSMPRTPKIERADGMYYKFLGWYTGKSDGELFDFSKPITKDSTIYPRFSEEPFKLNGKVISLLGDSITTYYKPGSPLTSSFQGQYEYYYPNPNTDVLNFNQTWWYTMLSKTETNLGLNNSRGGAKVYNGGNEADITAGMNYSRINDLGKNGNPDIIVIYMGTNDYVTTVTESEFRNAYNVMLNRIYEVYPNVDVFISTIHSPGSNYAVNFRTRWMAFNNIIRDIANARNIPLIEFDKAITDENHSTSTSDALHPNASGMLLLGNRAAKDIKKYYGLND
ncbi:MAG: SGNH/GDSL hydrolase family protein [Bacilli bacterium]